MVATTVAPGRAGSGSPNFYFYMALACVAVAFLGFAPTYWRSLASGTIKVNPIIHVHAAVAFSWVLFYAWQTWLASSGRVGRHQAVGLIGISFATAMTIFAILAAVAAMKLAASMGLRDQGIAFATAPLSGIVFFAVVFALAIRAARQPETHKRLMLLATISLLNVAVARWFTTFLAPPGPPGPPPVPATIAPAFVAYLLVAVAAVHDWRTRGRPHRVYVLGGGALLGLKVLIWPASETGMWHSFAGWVLALAQ